MFKHLAFRVRKRWLLAFNYKELNSQRIGLTIIFLLLYCAIIHILWNKWRKYNTQKCTPNTQILSQHVQSRFLQLKASIKTPKLLQKMSIREDSSITGNSDTKQCFSLASTRWIHKVENGTQNKTLRPGNSVKPFIYLIYNTIKSQTILEQPQLSRNKTQNHFVILSFGCNHIQKPRYRRIFNFMEYVEQSCCASLPLSLAAPLSPTGTATNELLLPFPLLPTNNSVSVHILVYILFYDL